MNLAAEIATVTPDELTAAFRESRLRYTKHYGLFHALQIPSVRKALELHAVAMRRAKQQPEQQHGTPAPTMQAAQGGNE